MTKSELFSIALDMFNMDSVTEGQIEDNELREVKILNLHFREALYKVSEEAGWTFLDSLIPSDVNPAVEPNISLVDNGRFGDYPYSYIIPEDIFRITHVYSDRFRVYGNILATDCRNPVVFGQLHSSLVLTNRNIPYEFWVLVAYALAFVSSSSLSSNDQKIIQMCAEKYNSTLLTAISNDQRNNVKEYVDDEY